MSRKDEKTMPRAAWEAAERAAGALAPEVGLLGDTDPAALGRSLSRALLRAPTRPAASLRASLRYARGMTSAALVAGARAVGAEVAGPMAPDAGDRRFTDPAWDGNPWFYWRVQRHLLLCQLTSELVEEAGLDEAERRKAAFGAEMLLDALAPTNFLWSNPTALKRAFDTGGHSVRRGLRRMLDDIVHNQGRPQQVDAEAFTVGEDLAVTPGKVVYRNDLIELIQYQPQTEQVHEIPLLCSPPWINKYYIMDLTPGRSFIEWAVQHGHTVFAISYRNPDESMRDLGMDDYLLQSPLTALDVISDITGAERIHVAALCLGGTLGAAMLAYLAATGDHRVRSATLLNTLVDFSEPGPLGVFTDEQTVARLERQMADKGYLEASKMGATFDVLRANDLIWSYVARSWLMGEGPPAFDLLAWNADSTNMPAAMHSFYLRNCYLENRLARGELELAGQRLDLARVDADTYVVGAEADHIAPWRSSFKTVSLLPKADVRYVLSSSGHIAGIVNPPSPKARYWTGGPDTADPDLWREQATEHQGSWWEDWAAWAAERAGELTDPPPVGSEAHPPLEDAPGTYVRS